MDSINKCRDRQDTHVRDSHHFDSFKSCTGAPISTSHHTEHRTQCSASVHSANSNRVNQQMVKLASFQDDFLLSKKGNLIYMSLSVLSSRNRRGQERRTNDKRKNFFIHFETQKRNEKHWRGRESGRQRAGERERMKGRGRKGERDRTRRRERVWMRRREREQM